MRRLRPPLALAATLPVLLLAGCDAFRSDSENFNRRWQAERARRVDGMRAATAQTPRGTPVSGDALRALVAGRTHVSSYEVDPGGRRGRYVEYRYFRADGGFVYLNSSWATDPSGTPGDRWRVDGSRLCVVSQAFGPEEHCYAIAVAADGAVQYFVAEPGTDTDGLLTRVVTDVRDGPPPADPTR